MSEKAWNQLRSWGRAPGTVAVLTDIDGVLAPIVPTPDMSEVSEELREPLRRLSGKCRVVAGISGRAAEDALRLVGLSFEERNAAVFAHGSARKVWGPGLAL